MFLLKNALEFVSLCQERQTDAINSTQLAMVHETSLRIVNEWDMNPVCISTPQVKTLAVRMRNEFVSTRDALRVADELGYSDTGNRISALESRVKNVQFNLYMQNIDDFESGKSQTEQMLTELHNCVSILLPEGLQKEGVFDKKFDGLARSVVVPRKNEDTEAIFENIQLQSKQLKNIYPKIIKWLDSASKVDDLDHPRQTAFIKKLIDLKRLVNDAIATADEIGFMGVDDSDEDEEFENVVAPYYQLPKSTEIPVTTISSNPVFVIEDGYVAGMTPVFTEPISSSKIQGQEQETEAKCIPLNITEAQRELYSLAPIIPFTPDLDYWGRESVSFQELSTHSGLEYHHRFLGDSDAVDRMIPESELRRLKQRPIPTTRTVRGNIPMCGARLKNNELCKRRDLVQCPSHGLIILRDEHGDAVIPSDESRDIKQVPEWQKIEHDILGINPIAKPYLQAPKKKSSARQRILKRVTKNVQSDNMLAEQDLAMRDKMAFRW